MTLCSAVDLFRKPHSPARTHYGYRFEKGAPIAPTAAYKGFKGALAEYSRKYSHFMSFDVASYFNSVYHHDIVSWFVELGASASSNHSSIDELGSSLATGGRL
jgi:hypothetical protein